MAILGDQVDEKTVMKMRDALYGVAEEVWDEHFATSKGPDILDD